MGHPGVSGLGVGDRNDTDGWGICPQAGQAMGEHCRNRFGAGAGQVNDDTYRPPKSLVPEVGGYGRMVHATAARNRFPKNVTSAGSIEITSEITAGGGRCLRCAHCARSSPNGPLEGSTSVYMKVLNWSRLQAGADLAI